MAATRPGGGRSQNAREDADERRPLLAPASSTGQLQEQDGMVLPPAASGQSSPPVTHAHLALVMSAIVCSAFLNAFDLTVISSIYPTIGSEFKALNQMPYVTTAYLLANTAFQPMYGRLSDIFGRKNTLLMAQTIFLVGTLGCGVSRNLWSLVLARAIAGVGGGGINVVSVILLTDLVPARQRGIYQGLVNVVFASGSATGAPVGGILADSLGWRYAFLFQLPVCCINIAYVFFFLKVRESSPDVEAGKVQSMREKFRRIDFLGAFVLVSAVACVIVATTIGGNTRPWSDPLPITLLCVGAGLIVIFYQVEARYAREPIMPIRLVKARTPLLVSLCNLLSTASYFAQMFTLPLFYRAARHLSAAEAGKRFIPLALGGCTGSLGSGLLMARAGKYYTILVVFGLIYMLGSVFTAVSLNLNTPSWQEYAFMLPLGLGFGGQNTALLIALLTSLLPGEMASATGSSYLFRSTGSILGISASSSMLNVLLLSKLSHFLPADSVDAIRRDVGAIGRVLKDSPALAERVLESYNEAVHSVLMWSLIIGLAGYLCSLGVEAKALGSNAQKAVDENDPRVEGPGASAGEP
ncbi:hypothetical protein PYCC9005_002872 [Savitreella phatthalungensis]